MASAAHPNAPSLPAVQRYFEISLFLLVSTGILAIVSTGKLDPVSTFVPSAALAYKGYPLVARTAAGNFAAGSHWAGAGLFPVLSRSISGFSRATLPTARRTLRCTRRCFRRFICCFSRRSCGCIPRRTNRDYAFPAVLAVTSMLASAILTVETGFLVALAIFLVLAVSTFVALEMRRSADGAVSPPFDPGSPLAQQLNRALGITSVLVAISALAPRHGDFLSDSAVHHRLPERAEPAADADDRLQRQCPRSAKSAKSSRTPRS